MDDRPSPLKPPPRPLTRPSAVPAQHPARRWLMWGLAGLVLLAALGWVIFHAQPKPQRGGRFTGNGPMPVVAAAVSTGDMPVTLNALGTVTPLAMVTVRTQINGQLTQVAFREGQEVTKGDFLAEIDPRPYQAALENAQGVLARDQAQLENAKRDLARYTKLAAENSIAVQQRDTQEALVKQLIGTTGSDQAAVDTAKLNLAYCHIVAPVSGRVGLRQVDPGNYVQVSDANGIVIITQLKPISAIFTLPEDNLPAITKRLNAGATLAVTAYDRSRTAKLADGALTTVDNQIDTTTGTVKMRAQFDNGDEILFPNQFVNVQLLVDTIHDATLVSSAAIERGAPGTFVYVVKPDNTVAVQAVKLGPSDGDRVSVTSGLTPGQQVVVDGADKLRDGAKIALPAEKPQGTPAAGEASNAAPASGQATGDKATTGQASKTDAANGQAGDQANTGQQRRRRSQQ